MIQDTTKHQGMRKRLVELLKSKGIKDQLVLGAIGKIPRHIFMDSGFESHAYQDKAFPIASGQPISQPYTVAFQTELLSLQPNQKVLEIGTGSGYQTAVLIQMGMKVYSIERQHELFRLSLKRLPQLGLSPKKLIFGDGYKGYPDQAPFNAIIVTAGAPEVPKTLLAQLDLGGRLVVPVGSKHQKMMRYTRTSKHSFDQESFGDFRFVPMLGDKN